jgi:hypothetical protein
MLYSFAMMAFDGKTQRMGLGMLCRESISWPSALFSMPRFIFPSHAAKSLRSPRLPLDCISVEARPHVVKVISEA